MKKLFFFFILLNFLKASDYAIIIGCCGEYKNIDDGIPLLKGVKNDANEMLNILLDRGVKRSNIDYLIEEDATYLNIRNSIKSMTSKPLKKGDTFYLFYSGHGTSLEDRSSFGKKLRTDEELLRRLEESTGFIPYDFDMNDIKNTLLITSRDFRPYFEILDKKGVSIIWIADACFSGNAYRSIGNDDSKKIDLTSKAKSLISDLRNSMALKSTLYKNLIFYGATTTNIKTTERNYKGKRRGEFSVEIEKCLNSKYNTNVIRNKDLKNCLKKNYPPYIYSSSIYPIDIELDNQKVMKSSDNPSVSSFTASGFVEKLFTLENSKKALDLNIYSILDESIVNDVFCKGEELAINTKQKAYIMAFTVDINGRIIMLVPNSWTQINRLSNSVVRTVVQAPFGKDRVKIFSTQNIELYKKIAKYKDRKEGILFSGDIENIYNTLKQSKDFETALLEVKTIKTPVNECRKGDK